MTKIVELNKNHAKQLHQLKLNVAKETNETNLVYDKLINNNHLHLKKILEYSEIDRSVLHLGAFINNQLVGYIFSKVITPDNPITKHVATFGMYVLQENQRHGLGTLLLETAVYKLRKLGVIRLEGTVRSTNENAIKFYKNMGFKIEGTRVNSAYINNQYINEFYISKDISS